MSLMRITYEEPSGNHGATIVGQTFAQHPLNNITFSTIPGASLDSNQITLPPDVYELSARVAKPFGFSARLALYSVTRAAYIAYGCNASPGGAPGGPGAAIHTPFALNQAEVLELHLYVDTASPYDTGSQMTTGDPEVYAEVVIRAA